MNQQEIIMSLICVIILMIKVNAKNVKRITMMLIVPTMGILVEVDLVLKSREPSSLIHNNQRLRPRVKIIVSKNFQSNIRHRNSP